MTALTRASYAATIQGFLAASDEEVLGHLSRRSELALEQAQRNAWMAEIAICRKALRDLDGLLLLEYSIPRMGRRADAVLLFSRLLVVVEFKIGATGYSAYALDQVFDYALDLKNFHKHSHDKFIVPLLLASDASPRPMELKGYSDGLFAPVCACTQDFPQVLSAVLESAIGPEVDVDAWLTSVYCPTPTIVEAAQALYQGHGVAEISRSEAGAENLTKTADTIADIISGSQKSGSKCICFVTGVPGAGKTLAGLNIANSWHDPKSEQHAVFLSGNGPLVRVLREALARDDSARARASGERQTKATSLSKVKAFVQNIHHFRDDALAIPGPPVERVAVFDEAQRAWDLKQTAAFMKSKKGINDFRMSEPQSLISVMDRHDGWATIVCLVGGGQEINTGEAGLVEWFRALCESYPDWVVCISGNPVDSEYTDPPAQEMLRRIPRLERRQHLHLATSIRSFRAESVSAAVKAMLDCDVEGARQLLKNVLPTFPVVLTRDLQAAKCWLRQKARGTERYGILASSEAQRLKPFGLNVKAAIDPVHWFLNNKSDVRSSFYLEDVATEFQVQGLELDWTCIAWDGDFRFSPRGWEYHCFRGSRWQTIRNEKNKRYLKNAYRVLLTRARQGMVLFVPEGSQEDHTRRREYYDHTYEYLRGLGIPDLVER